MNIITPNYNKYGINNGRTNRGIPALHLTRQLLNSNAIIIYSYEGGGRHSHLVTSTEYFAVATDTQISSHFNFLLTF
jgi:hypothetical protein